MRSNILEASELSVKYSTPAGTISAVDSVNFEIIEGETLGLVGESGSGKSTLGLSLMKLIPPPGIITSGRILYNGADLLNANEALLQKIRGREISMVFQDPSATLNPLMKIKDHFLELFRAHEPEFSMADATAKAKDLLEDLGIASERFDDYPHQLSGGMKQRVCIGLAIALSPKILIADEPTTALDVIVEAQILDLLRKLKKDFDLTLLLITHNMGVVAEIADRIAVMYGGKIVEVGDTFSIFRNPLHPYTEALLRSVPNLRKRTQPIKAIPGTPPDLANPPQGCLFQPRCPKAFEKCVVKHPRLISMEANRQVACYLHGE